LLEDLDDKTRDLQVEKKKFQDRDTKRGTEMEDLNHSLIDERNAKAQLEEKFRKASDDAK
jgi:hypothetical protein